MKLFLTGERFTGARGRDGVRVPGSSAGAAECKKLVRRVPQLSTEDGFKEMAAWSVRKIGTSEAADGMAAFCEKRKLSWVQG